MKKKILIALTILCIGTMAGCGSNTGTTANNQSSNNVQENSNSSTDSNKNDSEKNNSDDSKKEESSNSKKGSGLTVVTENLPDYVSAEKEDVLVEGQVEVNIMGAKFDPTADYTTVIRPALEAIGVDMDEVESSRLIIFTNDDGYSRQVEINVQEVDGVKVLKHIAYGIPDEGRETDKEFEDSIMSINGYKSSEAAGFAAELGVGRNGKVFINNGTHYLILREGTLRVYKND